MISSDCHPDRKNYARRMCSKCYWKWNRSQKGTAYRANAKARIKKWRMKNRDAINLRFNCKKRGITVDNYTSMLVEQLGLCKICREPMKRICIDHDHATGEVRGLLCHNCNVGLGHFRDSVSLLEEAAKYLAE